MEEEGSGGRVVGMGGVERGEAVVGTYCMREEYICLKEGNHMMVLKVLMN